MAYDLYQKCGLCINGFITVDEESVPCAACGGTGKMVIGDIPNLEVAMDNLSGICKTTLEICEKILSVVGKA
jgi:hypothetical protein